jgi:hypothetical protein
VVEKAAVVMMGAAMAAVRLRFVILVRLISAKIMVAKARQTEKLKIYNWRKMHDLLQR